MHDRPNTPFTNWRTIEHWLPFVSAQNQRYGWNLPNSALERLIERAAPALNSARSPLAAQAILWHHYQHLAQESAR